MADQYSIAPGAIPQGVSMDQNRRLFNFGERVAELAPAQSPFFVYLSKVAKKATDDPVFKFLEQRHQWQRRNGANKGTLSSATAAATGNSAAATTDAAGGILVDCNYDKYGKAVGTAVAPGFFLVGQVIAIQGATAVERYKIAAVYEASAAGKDGSGDADAVRLSLIDTDGTSASALTIADNAKIQVIGTVWSEGSLDPEGWKDEMFDREGFCQIFKTAIPMFSGTALATRYRGKADEYKRVWTEKLMEHKMDLEHTMLFGVGGADESNTAGPARRSHGIIPYTESNGKVYSFKYASSGYDAFLDAMEDFFAPESGNSGNKLVLASRKVITYLNKLGSGSFLNNSVGSSQYKLDVQSIKGNFGHQVTMINTIFGNLHFVADPLLRGPWEDYCVAVDMANVSYRPLKGNGVSRDTHIITNVQTNNMDGRKDMILTEAGLEVQLPETHAVMKWS
tara:strand:+ start:3913 stop:5268 length:1356 start_codon:yes stop_codon:yes gene_type:complete